MNISELRKKELVRFSEAYGIDRNEASKIINSFYKFCGLEETLLYRENDEKLANSRYTAELQEKEARWIERLNKYLSPYKLKLVWFGCFPSICEKGTTKTALRRYFYN